MTCPTCEQMLRMLEALSGPEPDRRVLFGRDIAVVVSEGEDPYFIAIERGTP